MKQKNELLRRKTRQQRHTLGGTAAGVMLLFAVLLMAGPVQVMAADVVVYKSPTCGCCTAWVEHLEKNGLSVEVHDRYDMDQVKDQLGVPERLRSCHTAIAGNYLIEGHVPADQVIRALTEKPAVMGLAVPGMPMGSPGMEGPRKDDYAVLTFSRSGDISVYAER